MNIKIFLLLIFFSGVTHAQVTIKMGYGISFVEDTPHDMFRSFSQRNNWLNMENKHFNNMQGVMFGVRYSSDYFATEVDISNNFWTIQGAGTNPTTGSNQTLKVSLVNTSLGYGLEGLFGNFGLGTSIHYNWFNQKVKTSKAGTFFDKSDFLSQKVFLGLYIPGSKHTMLAFRPFVEIPYGKVNLFFTEKQLEPDRTDYLKEEYDFRFSTFGIQFLFFNGG